MTYREQVEKALSRCSHDHETMVNKAALLDALDEGPGVAEAARILLNALERAQIDRNVLDLFFGGLPVTALRRIMGVKE